MEGTAVELTDGARTYLDGLFKRVGVPNPYATGRETLASDGAVPYRDNGPAAPQVQYFSTAGPIVTHSPLPIEPANPRDCVTILPGVGTDSIQVTVWDYRGGVALMTIVAREFFTDDLCTDLLARVREHQVSRLALPHLPSGPRLVR